jgi:hypothetical protein
MKIVERLVSQRPGLARAGARARSDFLYRLARELHAGGQRSRAATLYRHAWATHASNPKPLAALLLCLTGPLGDAFLRRVNRLTDRRRRASGAD